MLGFLPMPYVALYAATKHAIEGYSESLDHELRTRGIRVSVIEPAYTKTQFDANLLQPDSKLDEYREVRAALGKKLKEVIAAADEPGVVADVVLQAATAARPKLRYTAGRAREPPAIASQICTRRHVGRRHSKRPAARRAAAVSGRMDARTLALLEAPIGSTLLRLAMPNMLVMVAQSVAGLVETYFIGKLGTDALAGVALVFPGRDAHADDVGGRDGRRHRLGDRARARRRAPRGRRRAGAACARHRARLGRGYSPSLWWAAGRWLYHDDGRQRSRRSRPR